MKSPLIHPGQLHLIYIKDLYEKRAFTKDALMIRSAAATQLFVDGKAAMHIGGSWLLGHFNGYGSTFVDVSSKVAAAPVPMLPNGKNAKHISVPADNLISHESFVQIWKNLPYIVTGKKTATEIIEKTKQLNKNVR
ncbi:MAG: hypothetical protein N2645_06960 [Clostridia bacterium]|nr:hypothetical protein [Clostridia bacterium]